MPRKSSALEKEQTYREMFLGRLNQKLALPTPEWPTVRCWTEPALNRIIKQVRDGLASEGVEIGLSHRSLLEWICRLRLASPIPAEGESIYLVEIGASAEAEVDPLELLMAAKPSGVTCYFSAVAFHALTTQLVEHHHVAELRPEGRARRPDAPRNTSPRRGRPLGAASPVGSGNSFFVSTEFRSTPPAARPG